jgi:hypothetical protein
MNDTTFFCLFPPALALFITFGWIWFLLKINDLDEL